MARGPIRAVLVSLAVVVLAGALLASGYVVLRYAPNWFGHPDTKLTTAQATERGDARTAALAFLAGLVAASGALFTAFTFRLSRRGQGTERFNKAVELLGHNKPNVRIGGIHALGQLARDDPRAHHRAVLDVLVAYSRDRSPWPPPGTAVTTTPPPASLDVRAAMSVLSRRKTAHDPKPLDIDLSKTNLCGVRAPGIRLREAVLYEAQLQDAELTGADLRDADLVGANLESAVLEKANLAKASLVKARLAGSKLRGAKGLDDPVTKLKDAIYDELTTDWPDGFDPAKKEAIQKAE